MRITLKYASAGLPIEIEATPGFVGVLEPSEPDPLPDPQGAIAESLLRPVESRPLSEMARGRRNAVIVISDITRPAPNRLMLPPHSRDD